jgi:glycosyltransferase involved in cell wall biosynthesis
MRIAQVAPLYESVPPRLYGGTERVVSYLTEELVRMGHEVTLFASGDSETSARLVPACGRALWRDPECSETLPHHVRLIEMVFEQASRFDVIHFHCDYLHFPFLRYYRTPSVSTLHGMLRRHDLESLLYTNPDVPLVSISDHQRRPFPAANWLARVYHGLPRNLHTCRDRSEDYLLFIGRVSPQKRLDRAIEIALRSGRRLKVAAKIYDEDRSYHDAVIAPLLRESKSLVEFLGEVGGRDKDELIGSAAALLFPIDWPEPFGLVMIESLACGTPVIAWPHGSVPEIVEEGRTGYLVETIDDAVAAVKRIVEIDRAACRQAFEQRFDARHMARQYEAVYRNLVRQGDPDSMGAYAMTVFADGALRE